MCSCRPHAIMPSTSGALLAAEKYKLSVHCCGQSGGRRSLRPIDHARSLQPRLSLASLESVRGTSLWLSCPVQLPAAQQQVMVQHVRKASGLELEHPTNRKRAVEGERYSTQRLEAATAEYAAAAEAADKKVRGKGGGTGSRRRCWLARPCTQWFTVGRPTGGGGGDDRHGCRWQQVAAPAVLHCVTPHSREEQPTGSSPCPNNRRRAAPPIRPAAPPGPAAAARPVRLAAAAAGRAAGRQRAVGAGGGAGAARAAGQGGGVELVGVGPGALHVTCNGLCPAGC